MWQLSKEFKVFSRSILHAWPQVSTSKVDKEKWKK